MTSVPGKRRSLAGQRQPAEPFVMSLRLPPELAAELAVIAAAEGRSRSKQIEVVLRQFVQSYRQRSAA